MSVVLHMVITNVLTPINMKHDEFLEKYLRTKQDFDWVAGSQCVDLAKLYSKEVLWITLWSFGGTARSGWFNKSKTFDLKKWRRVTNWPADVPPRGAIIFYDEWLTGHVGIVDSATMDDVLLLEQNWATGNGKGEWYDAISFNVKRDYRNCFGWFEKR